MSDLIDFTKNSNARASIGVFTWLNDPNIFRLLERISECLFRFIRGILKLDALLFFRSTLFFLEFEMFEESCILRIIDSILNVEREWNVVEWVLHHCIVVVSHIVEQCFLIREIPIVLQVIMHAHHARVSYHFEILESYPSRLYQKVKVLPNWV